MCVCMCVYVCMFMCMRREGGDVEERGGNHTKYTNEENTRTWNVCGHLWDREMDGDGRRDGIIEEEEGCGVRIKDTLTGPLIIMQ